MILSSLLARTRLVIDPLRSLERAVYVTGSARSGTTWIAQLLCRALNARLLFEPMHHNGPLPGMPHFVDASSHPPELLAGLQRALSGTLNNRNINMFQPGGLFFRRVVKDIRPGLLSAVCALEPRVPVVLILRHPLEVAASMASLAERPGNWWDTPNALAELRRHADGHAPILAPLAQQALAAVAECDDPLAAYLAIWCVENSLALDCAPDARIAVVRYEDLLDNDPATLALLEKAVNAPLPGCEQRKKPSSTVFGTGGQVGAKNKWRKALDSQRVTELLAISAQFSPGAYYQGATAPQAAPPTGTSAAHDG